MKKNVLNNIIMGNKRKDAIYQTVITDLAIAGVVKRDVAEKLLGYKIPSFLKLEDGSHLEDEPFDSQEKPAKKVSKEKGKDPLEEGLGL